MRVSSSVAQCRTVTSVSRIKVAERGKCLIIVNESQSRYEVYQVDGCIVRGQPAADWYLLCGGGRGVIVELKGRDVEHAVAQIEATIPILKHCGLVQGPLAAVIVGQQYPSSSPTIQSRMARLRRDFRVHLTVKNIRLEAEYAALFTR